MIGTVTETNALVHEGTKGQKVTIIKGFSYNGENHYLTKEIGEIPDIFVDIVQVEEDYCECGSCGKKITIGESFQYETSGYTTYCDNTECTEGIATVGSCLEPCWFGEEL